MLVIALALVLLAAACAVVLTEASRSVIPPMAPIDRATATNGPVSGHVTTPLSGTVTGTIPMQRMPGQVGSAKADAARAYAFVAELPADKKTGFDSSL